MITEVPLTTVERTFVQALALGEPITTAAVCAGRSIGMASHLLHRPTVNVTLRRLHAHLSRVVARLDAGPKPRRARAGS